MTRRDLYNSISCSSSLNDLVINGVCQFYKNEVLGLLYTSQKVFVGCKPMDCSIGVLLFVKPSGEVSICSVMSSEEISAKQFLLNRVDVFEKEAEQAFYEPYSSLKLALLSVVEPEYRQSGDELLTNDIIEVYFPKIKEKLISSIFSEPDQLSNSYDNIDKVMCFGTREDLSLCLKTVLGAASKDPYITVSVAGKKYSGIPILIEKGRAYSRFNRCLYKQVLFDGEPLPKRVILGVKEQPYEPENEFLFMTGFLYCQAGIIETQDAYILDTNIVLIEKIDWR